MKIREFQEYIRDRLNDVEALVQGGCKAIAEDALNVASEVTTRLQTVKGIAVKVGFYYTLVQEFPIFP